MVDKPFSGRDPDRHDAAPDSKDAGPPAPAASSGVVAASDDPLGSRSIPVTDGGSGPAGRPTRPTPGGGTYAALLARSRPKAGWTDSGRVKTDGASSVAGAPVVPPPGADPLEITAVGGGVPSPVFADTDSNASTRIREVVTPERTVPTRNGFDDEITTVGGGRTGARRSAIPRPTRLTPGAGLAALLGRGGSPADSPGAAPGFAEGGAAPSPDAGLASEPQEKNAAFAGTIHGMAQPLVGGGPGPGRADAPWMRPATGGGAPQATAGDAGDGVVAGPAGRGEPGGMTERNAVPIDADSGALSFSSSASFSGTGPLEGTLTAVEAGQVAGGPAGAGAAVMVLPRRNRKAIRVAVTTGLLVVVVGLVGPRLWRGTGRRPAPTAGTSGAGPTEAPSKPAPSTLSSPGPSSVIPLAPAPSVVPAPSPPTQAVEVAPSAPPAAASAPGAGPAAIPAGAAPLPSSSSSAPPVGDPGATADKSHVGEATAQGAIDGSSEISGGAKSARARRSEARLMKAKARAKAKQKRAELRAAHRESATGASPAATASPPAARSKPGGGGPDPDGTLPLTGP